MAVDKMAVDKSQSQEIDLERTDRLPILDSAKFDAEGGEDAVNMDFSASMPAIKNDFPRPTGVDLPSLAESVRSVEERIARQNAEYETLSRSFEKAREAEAAAAARAQALTAELATLQSTLEAEKNRSKEADKALAEKIAAAEATRARIEAALRDAERYQSESNTLRETLAARDATIVQVLHSLGERDAQLVALQRDHAQVVPALEERSKASTRLEADLNAARARSDAMAADLKSTLASVAALTAQLKAGEHELEITQRELGQMKSQAASYLEQLRTREWRRGFDQNLFRELDAEIGAVQGGRDTLQAERDELRQRVADVELKLAARDKSIAKLKSATAADEALRVKHERELQEIEKARAALAEKFAALEGERNQLVDVLATQHETIAKLKAAAESDEALRQKHEAEQQNWDGARSQLTGQIALLETEKMRLHGELAAKDKAIDAARLAGLTEAERIKGSLASAEQGRVELMNQIQKLQIESRAKEDQMTVLMAHLTEARRPIETIEAEVKRLNDELHAKTAMLEALTEDNRSLRLAVERTRGALEEREFLIRRLERSESNNANVLGRIQTSIERLGASTGAPGMAAAPVECSAELVRVDGQHKTSHTLSKRTRIGRAPGCELQIESSSVSRHHALVLMGQRDVIIEDLNSTNGVLVNGRKVSRQLLNDGDMVMIGDAQFRFSLTLAPRVLEAPASGAGTAMATTTTTTGGTATTAPATASPAAQPAAETTA
jgi:chromosome segregation ATPase